MTLTRFCITPTAIIGQLRIGDMLLFTLELPWLYNHAFASCIPMGEYKWVPHLRPSGQRAVLLLDVPERTDILIHPGNTVKDIEGCIAPGITWVHNSNGFAVGSSLIAFDLIWDAITVLPDQTLRIESVPPAGLVSRE